MRSLSVIVPTLDEADEIEGTLGVARAALGADVEWIVADGGSRDGTAEIAEGVEIAESRVRVLRCPPGRGGQMNAGARVARGELLLFLHADTHLGPGARHAIEGAFDDAAVVGAAFRFALRGPLARRATGRLLTAWIRARGRLFRSATGDQGIVCRRAHFEAVAGYPMWPLFEDLELFRKLKTVGRVVRLPVAAATSDRRWREHGPWRTMWRHGWLRLAYHAGADPVRLARGYRRRTTP